MARQKRAFCSISWVLSHKILLEDSCSFAHLAVVGACELDFTPEVETSKCASGSLGPVLKTAFGQLVSFWPDRGSAGHLS